MADPFVQTVTPCAITAGQSLSAEVDIGGNGALCGIQVPANWTTAGFSFQCSIDGGTTFGEVTDIAGTALAVGSLTGGTLVYFVALDPAKFRGVRALKVRSGTQAAPVNQVNAVVLQLVTRQVF